MVTQRKSRGDTENHRVKKNYFDLRWRGFEIRANPGILARITDPR
jgi:hypothetical protein